MACVVYASYKQVYDFLVGIANLEFLRKIPVGSTEPLVGSFLGVRLAYCPFFGGRRSVLLRTLSLLFLALGHDDPGEFV
jgi:hypothetical protein